MNEHIDYTPDGKGFVLHADDGTDYTVPSFEDVYNKDKFLELMKKGGKAREWISRHNDLGLYVKNRDIEGNKLSKADAQLQARPRYMGDESWYDEDNYFWVEFEEIPQPLICQLRISNHNTSHRQYEISHLNDKTVDCQTCLNIIIGDSAYNRDQGTRAEGEYAIISIEAFFDEESKTQEEIEYFEKFIEMIRSGSQPHITMDKIRAYIDPNAKVIASQNGEFISLSDANIKPSQYDTTRKNRVVSRIKPRAWNKEKENDNDTIPKEFKLSDIIDGSTDEKYQDKEGEYDIFIYNGRRFALDYPKHVAFFFKTNGNLSKANPIPIIDENKHKKINLLREDKNMKILVKKNNKLFNLGEGKIYLKKELKLNEINGIDANIGSANGIQQAQMKARQLMNRNPSVTSASADAGKLDGQSDKNSGEGTEFRLPTDATGQQLAQAQNIVRNQSADDVQITFTKPENQNGSSTNESRIIEMRRNSIPFTKKELNKFLKEI